MVTGVLLCVLGQICRMTRERVLDDIYFSVLRMFTVNIIIATPCGAAYCGYLLTHSFSFFIRVMIRHLAELKSTSNPFFLYYIKRKNYTPYLAINLFTQNLPFKLFRQGTTKKLCLVIGSMVSSLSGTCIISLCIILIKC